MDQSRRDKLEIDFVDAHGIHDVLDALSEICYAKGEHLRSNWQDAETGRLWDSLGQKIDQFRAGDIERVSKYLNGLL